MASEVSRLLQQFWIIRDEQAELYYQIRDALPQYRSFLSEKLGYQLLINEQLIKLEKIPGKVESWMGLPEVTQTIEYAFLCLLLMFLEDKGRREQFVLSQLIDYFSGQSPYPGRIEWTEYRQRQALVRVLRFAERMYLIQVDDGNAGTFSDDMSAEVLYANTGVSRYFARSFGSNILQYNSWRDFEAELIDSEGEDRGIQRRQRVYRRLFLSPVVYHQGADDPDYAYIKQNRYILRQDIEEILEQELQVHKNGALIVAERPEQGSDSFPSTAAISDIALQMNGYWRERIDSGELSRSVDDIATVSLVQFQAAVAEVKEKYGHGWSKEYRDKAADSIARELLSFMEGFGLLSYREAERSVLILPLSGRMAARYPTDYHPEGDG